MRTADPAALWQVQLRLECKGLADSRIVRIPGENPDDLGSCYAVRYAGGGEELVFTADAPEWFVDRARAVAVQRYLTQTDAVVGQFGGRVSAIVCSTYRFAGPGPVPDGPGVLERRGPEHVVALLDGQVAAEAVPSRSNGAAAELWVHTEPAYRRRGCGRQVAAAWANAVLAEEKVPFYSHLRDNHASQALAAALGVIPLFDLAVLTAT